MKQLYYVAHPNKRGARPEVIAVNVAPIKSNFPKYAFMTGPFTSRESATKWRNWTITY